MPTDCFILVIIYRLLSIHSLIVRELAFFIWIRRRITRRYAHAKPQRRKENENMPVRPTEDAIAEEIAVWFREKGAIEWSQGLPLDFVGERNGIRCFAGSVLNLRPGNVYEIEADEGKYGGRITVETRRLPMENPPKSTVIYVYPAGYRGKKKEPAFDFRTAAERFHIIEDNTLPVLIPYDAIAQRLIDQLKTAERPARLLRPLQLYTVSIYEREFEALQALGLIDTYADTYAVLNDMSQYDSQTGIVIPDSTGGEGIFL